MADTPAPEALEAPPTVSDASPATEPDPDTKAPELTFVAARKKDGPLTLTGFAGPEATEVRFELGGDTKVSLPADDPAVELFRGPWADYVKEV